MATQKSVVLSPRCKDFVVEAAKLTIQKGNTETNEKIWDKIADELEIAGVAKEKISTELRNLVNKQILELEKDLDIPEAEHTKLNSGQYYRWVRKRGFQDPVFAHNENNSLPQGNDADSSSLMPEVARDKPFSLLRNQYIFICQEMRKQLKENIDLIKQELSPEVWQRFFEDQSETKKFFDKMQSMIVADFEDENRSRDNRQIILPTDRFLVMAIKFWAGNKWYGKKYHTIVKLKSKISAKKLSIFLEDPFSYSDLIYHVMIEPLNLHFLDIKCPECERYSLKSIFYKDGTWNIVCNNEVSHNDKKIYFNASLIVNRLEQLRKNIGGAGTAFLKVREIPILIDTPIKK